MTLTEAAACGTPAVATAITGHVDAVIDGSSGLLVHDSSSLVEDLADALDTVLTDHGLRRRLAAGALARARGMTWEATARGALAALAVEGRRAQRSARTAAALGPPGAEPATALAAGDWG